VVVLLQGALGELLDKKDLVGVVGSGMGDESGSENGDTRGAQGAYDTWHVGTGKGGGSSNRVVTGAIRDTPAQPARTGPSGAEVSSHIPRTPVQRTHGRGWRGWSGTRRRSGGRGGSGWSGGGGRMPTRSGGSGGRAGAGGGGSATT